MKRPWWYLILLLAAVGASARESEVGPADDALRRRDREKVSGLPRQSSAALILASYGNHTPAPNSSGRRAARSAFSGRRFWARGRLSRPSVTWASTHQGGI